MYYKIHLIFMYISKGKPNSFIRIRMYLISTLIIYINANMHTGCVCATERLKLFMNYFYENEFYIIYVRSRIFMDYLLRQNY